MARRARQRPGQRRLGRPTPRRRRPSATRRPRPGSRRPSASRPPGRSRGRTTRSRSGPAPPGPRPRARGVPPAPAPRDDARDEHDQHEPDDPADRRARGRGPRRAPRRSSRPRTRRGSRPRRSGRPPTSRAPARGRRPASCPTARARSASPAAPRRSSRQLPASGATPPPTPPRRPTCPDRVDVGRRLVRGLGAGRRLEVLRGGQLRDPVAPLDDARRGLDPGLGLVEPPAVHRQPHADRRRPAVGGRRQRRVRLAGVGAGGEQRGLVVGEGPRLRGGRDAGRATELLGEVEEPAPVVLGQRRLLRGRLAGVRRGAAVGRARTRAASRRRRRSRRSRSSPVRGVVPELLAGARLVVVDRRRAGPLVERERDARVGIDRRPAAARPRRSRRRPPSRTSRPGPR